MLPEARGIGRIADPASAEADELVVLVAEDVTEGVCSVEGDGGWRGCIDGTVGLANEAGGFCFRPELFSPVAIVRSGLRGWLDGEWLSLIWQFGHSFVEGVAERARTQNLNTTLREML